MPILNKVGKAVFSLTEAACKLVEADVDVNGAPINAPYQLHYDGAWYKVKIRRLHNASGESFIDRIFVIRPEEIVAEMDMPTSDYGCSTEAVKCKQA